MATLSEKQRSAPYSNVDLKVSQWISRAQTARIQNDTAVTASGFFGEFRHDKDEIDSYWEDSVVLSKEDLKIHQAALKIQILFRNWVKFKKLRGKNMMNISREDALLFFQNAVRRFLAHREYLKKLNEMEKEDLRFRSFCERMKEGIEVIIFSRKYGVPKTRQISIDDDYKSLCFKTSLLTKTSLPLNNIYEVNKGMSEFEYPRGKPTHKSYCFHLCFLGDRILDIEALSSEDCSMLLFGFEYLRQRLVTRAPFYLDSAGIPRRASSSVVQYCLNKTISYCRSEADRMRFESSLRELEGEYRRWQDIEDQIQAAHDEVDKDSKPGNPAISGGERESLVKMESMNEGFVDGLENFSITSSLTLDSDEEQKSTDEEIVEEENKRGSSEWKLGLMGSMKAISKGFSLFSSSESGKLSDAKLAEIRRQNRLRRTNGNDEQSDSSSVKEYRLLASTLDWNHFGLDEFEAPRLHHDPFAHKKTTLHDDDDENKNDSHHNSGDEDDVINPSLNENGKIPAQNNSNISNKLSASPQRSKKDFQLNNYSKKLRLSPKREKSNKNINQTGSSIAQPEMHVDDDILQRQVWNSNDNNSSNDNNNINSNHNSNHDHYDDVDSAGSDISDAFDEYQEFEALDVEGDPAMAEYDAFLVRESQ